jgi:hypothetical protein
MQRELASSVTADCSTAKGGDAQRCAQIRPFAVGNPLPLMVPLREMEPLLRQLMAFDALAKGAATA